MIDKIKNISNRDEQSNKDSVVLYTDCGRVSMPLQFYQINLYLIEYLLSMTKEFDRTQNGNRSEIDSLKKEIQDYSNRKDELEQLLKQSEDEVKRLTALVNNNNKKRQIEFKTCSDSDIIGNQNSKSNIIYRLEMLEKDHKIIRDALANLGYLQELKGTLKIGSE